MHHPTRGKGAGEFGHRTIGPDDFVVPGINDEDVRAHAHRFDGEVAQDVRVRADHGDGGHFHGLIGKVFVPENAGEAAEAVFLGRKPGHRRLAEHDDAEFALLLFLGQPDMVRHRGILAAQGERAIIRIRCPKRSPLVCGPAQQSDGFEFPAEKQKPLQQGQENDWPGNNESQSLCWQPHRGGMVP